MNKFFVLVKKELKQLINWQFLLSIVFIIIMFQILGIALGGGKKSYSYKSKGDSYFIGPKRDIYLAFGKKGEFEDYIKAVLSQKYNVNVLAYNFDNALKKLNKSEKIDFFIFIPEKAEEEFKSKDKIHIYYYKKFDAFGFEHSKWRYKMWDFLEENIIKKANLKYKGKLVAFIKEPIEMTTKLIIRGKVAKASSRTIEHYILGQTLLLSMGMMGIILMASSFLTIAIAEEKENKTLETILSMPIGKNTFIMAKITASFIVAILDTLVFMYVGGKFLSNLEEFGIGKKLYENSQNILKTAGISVKLSDYVLMFVVFFLAIMCALALSTIIGALVGNVKSAGTANMPIILLLMLPYFTTNFISLKKISGILKVFIFVNPFTYPYIAFQNVLFGDYQMLYNGIVYLLFVFLILLFINIKLFSSEKIFTSKI